MIKNSPLAAAVHCTRLRPGQRQPHREDRSLSECAGNLDRAAVRLDNLPGDRQPQPGPGAALALAAFIHLIEPLEDARQVVRAECPRLCRLR